MHIVVEMHDMHDGEIHNWVHLDFRIYNLPERSFSSSSSSQENNEEISTGI